MTEPVSERTKQRRRILRTAVAAPIVLTLPSGAALAAKSVTCDQKNLDFLDENPTTAFTTSTNSTSADSWMRIDLQKYSIQVGDDTVSGFEYENRWYEVTDDLHSAHLVVPFDQPVVVEGQQYHGLFSLENGELVFLPDQVDNSNPVSASCWSSLRPDINLNI